MSSVYELCHGHKRLLLLIEFALSDGWEVHRTPGGHLKFVKPNLPPIFTCSTASGHQACQNAWTRRRRTGRSNLGDRNG